MPDQQKKFKDLKEEQKDKIFSYMSNFWKLAENLKVPSSKINKIQLLLEEAIMGFLPPVEFLNKIKGIFELAPEKGRELEKEINSKIFFNLKDELAEMYREEEIGKLDFGVKKEEERLATKKIPAKTLGEELGLEK